MIAAVGFAGIATAFLAVVMQIFGGLATPAPGKLGHPAGHGDSFAVVENADSEFFTRDSGPQETPATDPARNQPILQQWNGDYLVAALSRLPKTQRKAPVGYIADASTFRSVWKAFMPEASVPNVDFAADLVVFARNVQFYNATSIAAVKLKDGVLDAIVIETMSSRPIEDRVSFAMAVVSRQGVTSLKVNDKLHPISAVATGRRD
jgi:hypothetical protein